MKNIKEIRRHFKCNIIMGAASVRDATNYSTPVELLVDGSIEMKIKTVGFVDSFT